jgi:hypothetical protein
LPMTKALADPSNISISQTVSRSQVNTTNTSDTKIKQDTPCP